ncbi:aldo/keto reductase [Sphaerisporangium siamense]|uniref:Aryl-alcohol dehydrogenase-like predicted oxidoreductase n=1 Tax=Sphaerisporangium siamense TaxID=795645 RepID=A0A7W7GA34_9ACTN|nr:aldo/keto reductase [Sphaerisporangium siamense]MBB4701064.1 aryl-alcohol dehydrogenase-like predicted oxidoreductase [Sphaerisporangium siamense]GII85791.1 aldo/keto reductase [Sphaerisporangium siamense]
MRTRELGGTGMAITTVGFGSWAVGGPGLMGWGTQSDDESIAAIHHAITRGVNWIDTAAVYGFGHAEKVVGRALAALPPADRPLLFTKCGLVWDENGVESNDLTPESIRRECDASLRRLGVDHIDLYQIHDPDPDGPPIEESWGAVLDLVKEGKVRHAGVSNFDVDLLERCEAVGHVASLQPPLSLIDRDAAADVIPWCAAHGTGVIVYSPMASGLLSGTFTAERAAALPDDDWRSRSAQFRAPALERNLALQEALRPIARRYGVSVATIAIAWTTACPGVTAAIVGARTPGQVDGWQDASDLHLTADDLAEITTALHATGAGHGPIEAALS